VYVVESRNGPIPLTSEAAILQAVQAGDITITRAAAADLKCPIQGR
jgi:hypothetical protein